MRRHIVRAFVGVEVERSIFGNKTIEDCVQVVAHVGVGIFIERECCRCVLDEEVEQSAVRQFRQIIGDVGGDEVDTATARGERKLYLLCH